ncbi:MAG: phosphoglycerate kinase [Xanthomonadaceae bacterium]|nr:phosphoglycerate kinase [Rhodospirillaceae bacterium]NIA17727.1 phosphoglycerate kinase [Xanthomonadaceae bacterium]
MKLRSIKNIKNLRSKRVIVRVGFNVPINKNKIIDERKIKSVLPTINYLIEKKAKIILISHLGRPNKSQKFPKDSPTGQVKAKSKNIKFKINRVAGLSLKPVAKRLGKLLNKKVHFISECVGEKVEKELSKIKDKDIVLLENLRFYKEEEENNKNFAKSLAKLGDIYINEAFSVSHRKHASISAITNFLPSYAGFLLEKEIFNLSKLFKNSQRPYILLLGGLKISTKIKFIERMGKIVDKVLIGGAMANIFLYLRGERTGKFFEEKKIIKQAKRILNKKEFNKKFLLPEDVIVAKSIKKTAKAKLKKIGEIQNSDIISDIGPKTIYAYSQILKKAKTILWNGPIGKFEFKQFSHGSLELAKLIAFLSSDKVFSVCGGGETIEVLNMIKSGKSINWVSTGGGAMLAFLANERMPGIEPLINSKFKVLRKRRSSLRGR